MTKLLLGAILLLLPAAAQAHPGVGLVIDRQGNIYFTDLRKIWRIDSQGRQTVFVTGKHTHNLRLDEAGNLYFENLRYDQATNTWPVTYWRATPNGAITEVPAKDFTYLKDNLGNSYGVAGGAVEKRTPDGRVVTLGGKLGRIGGIALGPDHAIYLTEGAAVRKISQEGSMSALADHLVEKIRYWDPAGGGEFSRLMGLDLDAAGNVYVANFGNRRVLRITTHGQVSTMAETNWLWSPSGVRVSGSHLYILEYRLLPPEDARVRKIALPASSANAGGLFPTAPMSTPRSGHTATALPDGKVLIAGGMIRNGEFVSSTEIYDPARGVFASGPSMNATRVGHTATRLRNGKVLVIGGWEGSYRVAGAAELFDPATGKFTLTGRLNRGRADHSATLLSDGRVLVAAGAIGNMERMADAEIYDPKTGRFTPTGSLAAAKSSHAAVLLKDGRVLIAGGSAGRYPNATIFRSVEIYDPARGVFTPDGELLAPRHKLAATLLPDGRVFVAGGSDHRDWRGKYQSAEIFDPVRHTSTSAGEMNLARFKHHSAIVALPNGAVLLAGGAERPEIYDPSSGRFFVTPGTVGDGRYFSTATLLPGSRVLIAGGYGENAGDSVAAAVLWKNIADAQAHSPD